jgi:cell division protein FtsI (penicillin-binding protein 3)
MTTSRANRRLALFMGFAVLFLAGLLGRAFYVQVIAAPALQEKAEEQHVRTVELTAPRGTIYDRNGNALAISKTMASIYANPRQIKAEDAPGIAERLSPILGLSEQTLLVKLRDDAGFRYLARRVDPAIGQKVRGLKIQGIGVLSEPMRVYPMGALAPQVLGFVGGTDYTGMEGIEFQYDEELAGESGEMQMVHDLSGNRLSTVVTREVRPGTSLTLTIDSELQFEAERALAAAVEEHEAQKACAVVIDPANGEILALANTPVFNTNDFASSGVTKADRRNWAVTDQYEPGSTFKMVVVAAALDTGLVEPDTTFTLAKQMEVYDKTIHEAEDHVPEVRELTVTQILAQSSNIGAVTLGKEVGKERLAEMIRRFGFTEKLGIDFPGEAAGQMLPPAKWNGVTIANVPMGQGIAASPLQLAAAYAAVANDGVLVQPHLVRGETTPWTRRVVSEEVAAQLREMLRVTVADGTGQRARLEGYVVAGKTGTAQKAEVGGYSHERFIVSFVGMVPSDDPRLVILVMVDEPTKELSGARVAAPVFAKIADFALRRLGVAPTMSQ